MAKPAGSSLFWHVDNNHPRCDITNIVDSPNTLPTGANAAVEQPPEKGTNIGGRRKK
jgi:hypothetical protein